MNKNYLDDSVVGLFPELNEFWEAAEQDRFLLKHCNQCNKTHWYPRMMCPHCSSTNLSWHSSKGEGSIYSYCVIDKATPPYVLAYIQLDEGPIIMSNLDIADAPKVQIGARVSSYFKRLNSGRKMPFFKLT